MVRDRQPSINIDKVIEKADGGFHEGAGTIIYDERDDDLEGSVKETASHMRSLLSRFPQQHEKPLSNSKPLSITIHWDCKRHVGVKEGDQVVWSVRYSLTLWSDDTFTLEYETSGDKSYQVRQNAVEQVAGEQQHEHDWVDVPRQLPKYLDSFTAFGPGQE